MTGYLNRPEATADTITADDWVRTGDIGRLDADVTSTSRTGSRT
jgi:long-subunit acyl-CoA synthetase (AMP-forming)